MNNREVAHAWAGQQKESARGSHFFFNGPSIYSYGAHFEIARIIDGKEIDGFRVDAWDGETLTVGCHTLKRDELARLAAVLGV